jgi:hypothetical protein
MVIPDWVILILLSLPPFLGVIWVYGTWKNWKAFMNPSDVLWFMWLWHLTREHLGEGGMKVLNYSYGILLLLGGIYFAFLVLKGNLNYHL